MSREQLGTVAEVSGTVLVPCSLAVSSRSQLQLVFCIPVSVLDPAAPSVVPAHLCVCPHCNQSLGAIHLKTVFFFWADFHLAPSSSSSTHTVPGRRRGLYAGERGGSPGQRFVLADYRANMAWSIQTNLVCTAITILQS